MFKKNINTTGRIIRFVLVCLLLAYAWWASSYIAFGLALFTLFEVFMSWCIIYQILGKNDCSFDKE